jgi:hypothetical protein
MSKVLKLHDSGTLQFSETCVHHAPHGLRMKDQLPTYRPRAYKDLSFGKQVEGGTYSSAKRTTELRIVSCQCVIVYDTHVFVCRSGPGNYRPQVPFFLRAEAQVLVSRLIRIWPGTSDQFRDLQRVNQFLTGQSLGFVTDQPKSRPNSRNIDDLSQLRRMTPGGTGETW